MAEVEPCGVEPDKDGDRGYEEGGQEEERHPGQLDGQRELAGGVCKDGPGKWQRAVPLNDCSAMRTN